MSYSYDAAGNRVAMSDGSGSTTYQYDVLSQMASETRIINGLSGSYTLSYVYNLTGQLKKITDPTGATINYNYDAMGRMTGITGENTLYNNVSQYASGLAYRAWGGLKSMAYGNTTSLTLNYNKRGLITNYSVSGVRVSGTSQVVPEGGDFQYYADGQLKFASDLRTDTTAFGLHDRAYSYDQVGRLMDAYSGTEARDFLNGTSSGIFDGAIRQTHGYDAWSNLISRTGRLWSEEDNNFDAYNSQNRNPAWVYDADGRLITRNEPSPNGLAYEPLRFTYDAAGLRAGSTQTTSKHHINPNITTIFTTVTTRTEIYDGDAVGTKSVVTSQTNGGAITTKATFYLRSTVLGGRTISEYDTAGIRQKAYIFAGGEVLAQQERLPDSTTRVLWQHINPVTGDGLNTDSLGFDIARATLDPTGVDLGDADPFAMEGGGGGGDGDQLGIDAKVAQLIPRFGGPQIKLDGFITSPYLASSAVERGAAEQCPDNDCNKRSVTIKVTYKDGTKKTISGLVSPFLVPAGINKTFYGFDARIAAAAFEGNTFEEAFKSATYWLFLVTTKDIDLPSGESQVGPSQNPGGEQLSPCLRDVLRQFFPPMKVHGKSYSPVDDARFKSGVPSVLNIFQDNNAVTLGLYDIRYNPEQVKLNGGNFDSLDTIVEELAHTVQFLQLWADNYEAIFIAIDMGGYDSAKGDWAAHYAYHAAKGRVKNGDGYKNDIEKWAKNRKFDILSALLQDKKLIQQGNVCGYNLTEYSLERPNW